MNKKLNEIIKSDIYRYYGKFKKPLLWKLKDHTLYLQMIYRKANFYLKENKRIPYFFYNFLLKYLSIKFNFNVSAKTTIGYGLALTHNGVYNINAETIIGDNCNIGVNTLIGQENRGKRKGCPVIGNKVWIGSNVIIVGHVTIGDNVLIAPGNFINFDIPSNSIVVNGKIIPSENSTDKYIINIYESI